MTISYVRMQVIEVELSGKAKDVGRVTVTVFVLAKTYEQAIAIARQFVTDQYPGLEHHKLATKVSVVELLHPPFPQEDKQEAVG